MSMSPQSLKDPDKRRVASQTEVINSKPQDHNIVTSQSETRTQNMGPGSKKLPDDLPRTIVEMLGYFSTDHGALCPTEIATHF